MKLIKNGIIYIENGVINNGYIIIKNNVIFDIGEMPEPKLDYEEIYDVNNKIVIPGFIDLQLNGGGGNLFMDADIAKTQEISNIHLKHGVTGFLGTVVAWTDEEQENALSNGAKFMDIQVEGARLLGMHMEGPFLNPKKAGAHYKEYLVNPSKERLIHLNNIADGKLRLITMAPELDNFDSFMEKAKELGISIAIGHSLADYDTTINALNKGVSMVTHCFNAMNGIAGREPGIIMGLIDHETAFASVICDGVHVHPSNLNLLKREIGYDRLVLVTDCSPISGTDQKVWIQNGMKIYIKNYTGYREDGILAGSSLTMEKAAKMAKIIFNCSTSEVIKMGAHNPAKVIDVYDKKGSLSIGKHADIVIIEDDVEFDPLYVFVEGELEFKK